MFCDRVIRRLPDAPAGGADADRLDWLPLAWDECHRRAVVKTTRRGREVRLLLRLGTVLRHGDVLADAADCLLAVEVLPVEVLVVRPRSVREAALVALGWGNLHVPVEVGPDEIVTLRDGPAEAVLYKHGVTGVVERRRFEPMAVSGVSWTVSASLLGRGSTA